MCARWPGYLPSIWTPSPVYHLLISRRLRSSGIRTCQSWSRRWRNIRNLRRGRVHRDDIFFVASRFDRNLMRIKIIQRFNLNSKFVRIQGNLWKRHFWSTPDILINFFISQCFHKYEALQLYFVSSRERPWRHWARPRIHAARRILYASIPVFLFERVRKHTSCARDDKRLPPEYVLTSRSFSRWDKV